MKSEEQIRKLVNSLRIYTVFRPDQSPHIIKLIIEVVNWILEEPVSEETNTFIECCLEKPEELKLGG